MREGYEPLNFRDRYLVLTINGMFRRQILYCGYERFAADIQGFES